MNIERLTVGLLGTNCYLVEDNGLTCVIDPGADCYKILSNIKTSNIEKIILTHGHFDHFMAAKELREKTNAPIFISKEDAPMTELYEKSLYPLLGIGEKGFVPFKADGFFGEEIEICKNTFKVIKTPGHSSGSVCLLCDDVLFSGDTLFQGSIGRYDFGDYNALMNSLEDLMLLDDDVRVYPGHGNETTIGQERRGNPYLR